MSAEQNNLPDETKEAENTDTSVREAETPWWQKELNETRNHDLAWSRDRN